VVAGLPFRGVNLWPAGIDGFRPTLLAYFDAVWMLGRNLHRAFAVDLGLAPDFFETKLDRPMATLRLLHYPPRPAALAEGQLGAGAHTDYGNLTLLATDEVGGLEVRRRDGVGGWIPAPVVPDAFVCNIGDCLMRWTNDTYVSTPHRVVSPAGRERYSVAFFLDPNPDALVACLDSCAGPDRPARYPPVTAADYLRQRLDATYAHRQAS
jgi:isopenicillin N synthase-like dioxygenase